MEIKRVIDDDRLLRFTLSDAELFEAQKEYRLKMAIQSIHDQLGGLVKDNPPDGKMLIIHHMKGSTKCTAADVRRFLSDDNAVVKAAKEFVETPTHDGSLQTLDKSYLLGITTSAFGNTEK